MTSGDRLSFDWLFIGKDGFAFNDFAYWTNPAGSTVLSSVAEVGFFGREEGHESFTAQSEGTFTFTWAVQDGSSDLLHPSQFSVNNIELLISGPDSLCRRSG
jgi:hypothetical protein